MKDLTNLKTFIIDSDDPHEVDDAISLETIKGNKKKIWVHISNPCRLFTSESTIDREAQKKSWAIQDSLNDFNPSVTDQVSALGT